MRQALATQVAVATGVLILVLAIIFALFQTPGIAETAMVADAPVIPHPLAGYEDCVSCHGRDEAVPYPDFHLGWPNTSCTQCHIADEAVAVATVAAVPLEAVVESDAAAAATGAEAEGEDAEEAADQPDATTAETPDGQIANGETVYAAHCAQCHATGGGGPILDAPTLATYRTARELFVYTQRTMPPTAPGSLSEQQYWNVVAYLLAAEALLPVDTLVGPETGDELAIDPS